jgi:hypothetical protein
MGSRGTDLKFLAADVAGARIAVIMHRLAILAISMVTPARSAGYAVASCVIHLPARPEQAAQEFATLEVQAAKDASAR